MIKVLHLFTTLDGGGVESFLYNYYSHMTDKEIRFDAIVPGNKKGYMEPMFQALNSRIYHIKRLRENPLSHWKSIAQIIKNGNYDVIHCHGYKSAIGLFFAKLYKCKVRIIHSHMAYVNETKKEFLHRKILTMLAKKFATDWFACGIDAAKWLFGDQAFKDGKVTIIDNAIDLMKYRFNEDNRKKIRDTFKLNNSLVVGNVGRLTYQKNQEFLLDIMKELLMIEENAKLLLIGDGEDKELLRKKAIELDLEQSVIFLGLRKDVPDLLNAMDIFVLPSRYEGLPVILVEAQAAGLVSCVSDTVTKEINITNLIDYLSLNKDAKYWAKKIFLLSKEKEKDRSKITERMVNGKYDINYQATQLYEKYVSMIKKCKGK